MLMAKLTVKMTTDNTKINPTFLKMDMLLNQFILRPQAMLTSGEPNKDSNRVKN